VERQIIESEKLASVGQVAASVAQEIGAPITALGLLVEQMRRDPEVVERYEDEIRTIQDLLDRVSRLSRQLVDLAKPGELALLAPALERGRIRLETDLDERRPPIQADPRQIEQVIVNLVLNAQRALAGRRQPRIRVSAGAAGGLPSAGTSKRRALEIRVADNGPGIEPEDLPHIFTPFFSRFGGSGLGLPVARQLLDRHGGTLHVESEPGHGATFIIHLPLDT
jgi:signal transduction histidine kinase